MFTLAEKVNQLKRTAYRASRTAQFWEQQIKAHGERKAEDFYLHMGHNHIERKSIEWEGLTLRREPRESEKRAVKGMIDAQESAKAQLSSLLLHARTLLVEQGVVRISVLAPQDYHTLILSVPREVKSDLRARLDVVYRQGRKLVAQELGSAKRDEMDEIDSDELLDLLAELSISRVANDVQARITGAATRYALLGLADEALNNAVNQELADGSVIYIDRASSGLANRVISIGRGDEARDRSDEWDRVEYSAILDQNVCTPCADEDGTTGQAEDDLAPAPNPECEGGDLCRCFHVWINQ